MTATFNIVNFKIVNQVSGIALVQYIDTAVAKADLTDAGFFNSMSKQLGKGSVIIGSCSDGVVMYAVASNVDGDVSLVNLAGGADEAAKAILAGKPVVGATTGATVTCSLSGTVFASQAAAETTTNYTYGYDTTGLTVSTATLTDANTVTLVFTGTVAAGTLSVTPKIAACKNGIAAAAGTLVIA